jgi:hypothetical protein
MAAEDNPKSLNRSNTLVRAVTIATKPKSFGSSKRASNIMETMRTAKLAA